MEVVKKGIHFIANGSNNHTTEIIFCYKDENGRFVDGLTNEGLIDVLISRFTFLVEKNGSEENISCLLYARKMKTEIANRNKEKIKRRTHDNSGNSLPLQVAS